MDTQPDRPAPVPQRWERPLNFPPAIGNAAIGNARYRKRT
jgi:hypothetical protein